MRKKGKKSKDSDEAKDTQQLKKMNKLDIMQKIDDLKSIQEASLIEGNNEKAVQCANQIIELAIRSNLLYHIKEQEDFLQTIAKKEQKKFFITEIEKECLILNEKYDLLTESNEISQAHQYVEEFKEKYSNNPDFDTLPVVKSLLEKDKRTWITYLSTPRDE